MFITGSREKIKETLTIFVLNIALPTCDVFSDLFLIIKLLKNGHSIWSVLLLVPFLLNYFLTWFLWWRIDKMRRFSWVSAALSWYPQFCAMNVIRLFWTNSNTEKGLKKKRELEREISEFEVFCEAVVSVLVITFIIMKAQDSKDRDLLIGKYLSLDFFKFYLAYSTSILTASLGLAKCLKVGPCRVFLLGGLCTKKFLFLVFTMGITLVSKGMIMGFAVRNSSQSNNILLMTISFCTMFLPGIIIGMMSICRNKNTIKIIAAHPSILLLPVFTYFTFSTNKKMCSKGENIDVAETRITFSRNWTLANIGASVLGYIMFTGLGVMLVQSNVNSGCTHCWDVMIGLWFKFIMPLPILSVFSTILFLFLEYCCCSCSKDKQLGVLKVNDPHTEYVVDKNNKGEEEIITMEEWRNKQELQDGNTVI